MLGSSGPHSSLRCWVCSPGRSRHGQCMFRWAPKEYNNIDLEVRTLGPGKSSKQTADSVKKHALRQTNCKQPEVASPMGLLLQRAGDRIGDDR